jgi:alanine racemase
VHLKIDTGIKRIGCNSQRSPVYRRIHSGKQKPFPWRVCTHFPVSDSADAEFNPAPGFCFQESGRRNQRERYKTPGLCMLQTPSNPAAH